MAIKREVTVTITGAKSSLDGKIIVFRNDRGIDLYLTFKNFDYIISGLETPVMSATATVAKPNGYDKFDVELTVIDKTVIFTITNDMTDEMEEVGVYKVQIHFFDRNGNRVSIPPFSFTVEPLIDDELAEPPDVPSVYARADFDNADMCMVAPLSDNEGDIIIEGQYVRTYWHTGDLITSARLNNLETGVSNTILDEDFTVTGVSIGQATDKKVYKSGTNVLQMVKDMLTNRIIPTYKKPTISFTSSISSCERGATISPTLRLSYTQNDGGDATSYQILDGSNVIGTNVQVILSNIVMSYDKSYSAKVNYSAGAIKYDNLGEPAPGNIPAGTLTANLTIKTLYPCFAYCSSSPIEPDSDSIRATSPYKLGPAKGNQIRLVTSEDTRLVVFAYPATLGECSKIRYDDLNDDNSKSIFTMTRLSIVDAGGLNPETFIVYYYIPLIAFGSKATFIMTI